MTDERRQEDRRGEDVRLAEEVAKLEDSIQSIVSARISEEWERAEAIHDQFSYKGHEHVEVTRLINILEGKPRQMPSGEIKREGGVLKELQTVTKAMSNGGVKIRIPSAVWWAIVVAIVTGLFNLVVALIASPAPW